GVLYGEDFILGGTIHFSCEEGFLLRGSTESTCLPSGQWSGQTQECVAIRCEPPIPPVNGSVLPQKTEYNYHESVEFRCTSGYTLEAGSGKRQCLEDGTWSGSEPQCQRRALPGLL
ncbi:hypothetical protein CAPTEDRAFT_104557, partial [Capitella teleta]